MNQVKLIKQACLICLVYAFCILGCKGNGNPKWSRWLNHSVRFASFVLLREPEPDIITPFTGKQSINRHDFILWAQSFNMSTEHILNLIRNVLGQSPITDCYVQLCKPNDN